MIDLNAQNDPSFPDYVAISAQFALANAETGVAEAQGAVYGLLCNNIPVADERTWLAYVLEADPDKVSAGPLLENLRQLYVRCDAVLQNPAEGFWMLLPDDTAPVAERTEALAAWCRGFLLGLLGPRDNQQAADEGAAFTGDGKELIEDLLAISEVEQPGIGAAASQQDGEEDEWALFEIQEYVQTAAQFFYEVTAPKAASKNIDGLLTEALPDGRPG